MDSATAPRLRILVVDDNADAADSLAMLLQLEEHETVTAYSGPEAIETARRIKPHAVFLDIGLPGMSGYDVARQLRSRPEGQGLRIYAMTGYGQDEDRKRSRQAGFDLHLTKPLMPLELERVLRSLGRAP